MRRKCHWRVAHRWNSALKYSRSATEFKVTELGFTAFLFLFFFSLVWCRWSAFPIPWHSITKILDSASKSLIKTIHWSLYASRGCLLGVCWRSLPGGGFLVSRSWTFSGPNVIYLYPDCRYLLYKSAFAFKNLAILKVSYYCPPKGQLWLELFKIVMWNKPDSLRSKTALGQFRAWWVWLFSKMQKIFWDNNTCTHEG